MRQSLLRIRAVAAREFLSSLASPSAWVFLILFLTLAGLCTFVVSDILSAGQADLTGFFNWMPWLFLFLVPALGMPFWSEERRTGTLELTLSYPVTLRELVLGKYLAGMMLLTLALLLTISIPGTVYHLGSPDTGAVLCGYFGALMIGSAFLAVSSFCSALTKSQTASFLLSLMFCSFLVFTGWDRITEILRDVLPARLCDAIGYMTIIPHYQAFQRGLLDTSEIVYCAAITLLFLFCTERALAFSGSGTGSLFARGVLSDRRTWKQLLRFAGGMAAAFYCFFCAVYAAEAFRVRFDCTSDRAYSLSGLSRTLVKKLDRDVSLRLYVSPSSAPMPGAHRQYAERVQWLLRELVSASDGRISLEVIHPEADSPEEEAALLDGILPVRNPTGETFYLGLAVSCRAADEVIPRLIPQQENLLEYDVIRKIRNVTADRLKMIGVMSVFPLLGRKPEPQRGIPAFASWHFFREIARDFRFAEVPMDIPAIPDELDVLMIVHPVGITKRAEYAIDQYLLRGGKVLVFVDPRSVFAEASARRDYSMMEKVRSDLPELFHAWGVRYDPETMAADLTFKYDNLSSSGLRQVLPSALRLTSDGISRTDPLTEKLTSVWMNFAGFLDAEELKDAPAREKILYSSTHAQSVPVSARQEQVFAEFPSTEVEPRALALRLSGMFRTAFPEGAPDAVSGEKNPRLTESAKPSEVWIFGDSDMLFHDTCVRQVKDDLGETILLRCSDNMTLIQNVLEHLAGEPSLAELRSRVPMNRPMEAIRAGQEKAEIAFRDRTMALMSAFTAESKKVETLRRMLIANPGRVRLTEEQQNLLDSFAHREAEMKREIRVYRNQLKQELYAIGFSARVWNILAVPSAAAVLGLLWSLLRRIGVRKRRKSS